MACNCATTEQLNALYKKYGEKKGEKLPFWQQVRVNAQKVGVAFCLIFITPAIVLYVFYKAFGSDDHRINMKKFFNLKHKQLGTNVG